MGPLVPFIFSNEFSLVVALISGIGFGFALEQAGFSSTKKLVGLFYGYDFTVLKVFFTAGVSAMIGVLLLAHFGFLDISLIYVNPTFLWAALVGGAIMGLGFVIGGFCPGTSICAASIGKIDGLAFVFGSALGVIIFAEAYPFFKDIYLAENWGPVLINEQLGMSKLTFAFVLTAIAFIAFYLTHKIENKVNNRQFNFSKKKLIVYGSGISLAFILLILISITPSKNEMIAKRIQDPEIQQKTIFNEIDSDALAFEIANNYYKINVIDVRTPEAYKAYHLPMAINIPFKDLGKREWHKIFTQNLKTNYFYADEESLVKSTYLWAEYLGKSDNYILTDNSDKFKQQFSTNIKMPNGDSKHELDIYKYRKGLTDKMEVLTEALKNLSAPIKVKVVKIKGGCS
ncbi:YeeE/YedE thiosulfate transporter family protein [Lutibacter sp. TH_r2]|uniref:YeeE/YedE thiosulfate transporter family protein n=1 Tax=Lutibacter sp. TH_r2 TaxID=3082083 RepID=UPI0029537F17|nr:YeeE/YedE thiosulfate transporter family protein [Lutibacter sp. TH_r2]MDV7188186.1 YeeE/YedE thiosulfate transporter family protein [Lutibacter sp. TH_r2]